MLILSVLVEVVGSIEDKQDTDLLETPLVVHHLLEVGVPIGEVIRVPSR